MKAKRLSRGPQVDVQKCMKSMGGNKYDMILKAADMARDISQRNKLLKNWDEPSAAVTALLNIQEGRLDIPEE